MKNSLHELFLRFAPWLTCSIVLLLLQSKYIYCQNAWRQFQIHGGFSRFGSLTINLHEPGILYVSSAGGIHRSSDRGVNWETKSFSKINSFLESKLIFDKRDSDHWMVIKKPVGLLHSYDRGKNFLWLNDGLELNDFNRPDTYFSSLTQNPFNPDEYLLSGNGIYHSTDRGTHWVKIMGGQSFVDIVYDVSMKDQVYATYSPGGTNAKDYFLKSTNNAVDWQSSVVNVDGYYPLYQLPDGTLYLGNLFSTDRGATWKKIKPAAPGTRDEAKGEYIFQYAYDPKHQYLYAVDQSKGLLKLKEGNDTWELTYFSAYNALITSHTRKPATSVAIDTLNERLYVVSGDSLFVSEKGGVFLPVPSQLFFPLVNQIAFNGDDTLLAAVIYNGRSAISINRGNQWKDIMWYSDIESAAYLPFDTFLVVQRRLYTLYYSFNNGETFNPGLLYSRILDNKRMDVNHLDPEKVFGIGNEGLFYITKKLFFDSASDNKVVHLSADSILGWILDFEFHPSEPLTYYIVSQEVPYYSSNLYKTTNGGIDWIKLTNNTGLDSVYRAIAVDPKNPNRIYIATDWGIIYTHDEGVTWNKGKGPMPNGSFGQSEWFNGIIVDPRASNIIYASARSIQRQHPPESNSSGGVYRSTDYGATWQPMNMEGLLNVSVNWLQYKDKPPRLIACTMGGAYEYILPDPVSVKEEKEVPNNFLLSSIYPNPVSSNQRVVINYQLPKREYVEITVYDFLGRQVTSIVNDYIEAGKHQAHLLLNTFETGMYYIKMNAGGTYQTKKLIVMR